MDTRSLVYTSLERSWNEGAVPARCEPRACTLAFLSAYYFALLTGLREPQPLASSKREPGDGVLPGAAPDAGLVLSLHGASVDAFNQAAAYAALPDFWIVAPTNRGAFGFDWQDWGREDAYEVLDHGLE